MAFSFSPELLISILVLLVVIVLYIKSSRWSKKNPLLPIDWPLVGILPSLVINLHRLHHYIAFDLLAPSSHSLKVAIASIHIFITCDPVNIQHIFASNHANYPKGEEYADIFDMTRGSLFSIDGESCRRERANYQGVLSNPRLVGLMTKCCRDKVEKCLMPFMTHMARTCTHVDMSDLMMRLVFDLYATTIFGVDPARLSLHMPPMDVANAMDTVMEVGFIRHIVPASCWKLMRRLNIGPERKLAAAQVVLRCFIADMITEKRTNSHTIGQEPVDVLSNYINDPNYNNDLLQATLITYMIAGRDTIGTTPSVPIYSSRWHFCKFVLLFFLTNPAVLAPSSSSFSRQSSVAHRSVLPSRRRAHASPPPAPCHLPPPPHAAFLPRTTPRCRHFVPLLVPHHLKVGFCATAGGSLGAKMVVDLRAALLDLSSDGEEKLYFNPHALLV